MRKLLLAAAVAAALTPNPTVGFMLAPVASHYPLRPNQTNETIRAWYAFGRGYTVNGTTTQWADISGNGRHLKRYSTDATPTLEADGTWRCDWSKNQYFVTDSYTSNGPFTILAQMGQVTWNSGQRLWDGLAAVNTGGMSQTGTTPAILQRGSANGATSSGLTLLTIQPVASVYDGANSTVTVGRTTSAAVSPGTTNPGGTVLCASGNSAGRLPADLRVKEFIVLSGNVALEKRLRMQAYLRSRTTYSTIDRIANQATPDASGGIPGNGFTNTCMARDPTDGTWWLANDGRGNVVTPGTQTASIVHTSADFSTKLGEIILPTAISGYTGTVQGVAYDTSDNTLWIAATDMDKIYHVSKAGAQLLGTINLAGGYGPNGLSYRNAKLAVGKIASSAVQFLNTSDGSVASSIVAPSGMDCLHWSDDATIYYTVDSVQPAPNIYVMRASDGALVANYNAPEVDAIEGIWVEGSTMYLMNDGYFHQRPSNLNSGMTFRINQ